MDAQSSETRPLFPKSLLISKVIAPIKYKRNIVRAVESLGRVEPIEVDPRIGADEIQIEGRRAVFEEYRNKFQTYLNEINNELLVSNSKTKIGNTEDDVEEYVEDVVENKLVRVDEIITRKAEISSRLSELESIISLLEKFERLNIEDTSILKDSTMVKTYLGTIFPQQKQRLMWEIDEITDNRYFILEKDLDEETAILLISVLKSDEDAVTTKLKTLNFQDIVIPKDVNLDGLTISDCKEEINQLEIEKVNLDEELDELAAEHSGDILAAQELVNLELKRIAVEQKMRRTETTCVMWAWIPHEIQEEFRTVIHSATEGSASFDFREGDFDPSYSPSYVENSEFMEPMRSLVTSFGTPGKEEIDPYPFVKFMFPILFGIMFADVGHGFLLLLLGYYFYQKKKKMIKEPQGLSVFIYGGAELMIIMGLTAMVMGVLMNSFFGDETILWQITPLRKILEPTTWGFFFKTGSELPQNVVDEGIEIERDYIKFLVFSFAVGAVVIITGLVINLYQLRYHRHSDADIQAAGTLLGTYVFAILTFVGAILWGSVAMNIFLILTVACLLGTLIIEGRAHGMDGLMLGVDHVLSLMSNTFSFGRLLAMNTIHFVLAWLPYLFIDKFTDFHILNHSIHHWIDAQYLWVWIIAAFIGSVIVVPVETTFSTLQALRLNWVEFFGKFYKGNGTAFKPVKVDRQYTVEI